MRKQEETVTFLDLYKELMGEGEESSVGNSTDAAALAAQAITEASTFVDADVTVQGGAYRIRAAETADTPEAAKTAEDAESEEREAVFVGCNEVEEERFVVCAEVTDPTTGQSIPVREIAERAFWQAGEHLKEIVLPDSITRISDFAFIMAPSLTTVRMSKSVEVLGEDVLDMTAVEELWLPNTVREIAKPHLYNKVRLSIEEGNPNFFSDGVGLYRIVEDSMELVAVSRRPEVTSYTVSENTICIADYAFDENWYLKEVVLPEGLQSIGREAFSGCESLQTLSLPDSLVSIGAEAFHGCPKLHHLEIGPALTSLGARCLTETFSGKRDNRGIFEVGVSADNSKFFVENNALMAGGRLIKYLGDAKEYTVKEGVTCIGEQAFLRSKLVHISLPSTLECVEKEAFWGMEEIERFTIASDSLTDGEATEIYIPQSPAYRKTGVCEGFYAHGEGESFDYAAYDASFATFHTFADRCRMAACRLRFPFALSDELMYRDWLAENTEAAAEDFATREVKSFHDEEVCRLHREVVRELSEAGAVNEENIDRIIETANLYGATELLADLMDLKNERFSEGFSGFDFSL